MAFNASINISQISPEIAAKLLENLFPDQRVVRESYVDRLAKEMTDGTFRLSSDSIVIVKGLLANGQHRLRAVVKSGKTEPFLIMKTDDSEIYKIIDAGIKRTIADALGHATNRNDIAAAAAMSMSYQSGTIAFTSKKYATRSEILNYCDTNLESLEIAGAHARRLTSIQRLLPRSVVGSFIHLATSFDKDQPIEFMNQVFNGNGTSPIAKLLRDRLIREALSRTKLPVNTLLALVIKAYSAFYELRDLKVLKISDGDSFPKLPGD